MNSITIIGRTTSELELKTTNSGKMFCSFTLAVAKRFKREETNFIPVVAWEKQAEILSKYVSKGNLVGIRGELTSRKYEDNNGNKRTVYEVLAEEVELIGGEGNTENAAPSDNAPAFTAPAQFEDVTDDEALPF